MWDTADFRVRGDTSCSGRHARTALQPRQPLCFLRWANGPHHALLRVV